jgi:hypothetical protein
MKNENSQMSRTSMKMNVKIWSKIASRRVHALWYFIVFAHEIALNLSEMTLN